MHLRFALLGMLVLSHSMPAGVKAPVPAPVRLKELTAKLDGVRVDFGDKAVLVRDAAWVARFRRTLEDARLIPDEYCFCTNSPTFTLLAGNDALGTFEVPHGRKLRMYGATLRGEFVVGDKTGRELGALADEVSAQARPKEDSSRSSEDPRKPPRPPDKVDVKL